MQRLTSASFSPALRAWLDRGRHHNVNGRRVFVVDVSPSEPSGKCAPLLVLHGYPTSSFDWRHVLPAIARRRRVVLFDLPGFGFSDKPERYSYSLFEQTDVVEGLCQRLGLDAPHIVAHDMGASIACELVARKNRKLLKGGIASIVFTNAGLYQRLARTTTSQKVLQTSLGPAFAGMQLLSVFRQQLKGVFERPVDDEEIEALWEQITYLDGHKRLPQVSQYLGERVRFEERWIGALKAAENLPVHVIWGSHDPASVVAIAEKLVLEVGEAQVTRLERVGHYPHLEAPDEMAAALNAWLDCVDVKPPHEVIATFGREAP